LPKSIPALATAVFSGMAILTSSGCGDSYEKQVDRLEKHVQNDKIGGSTDHWLVKGSTGEMDRVALFFGYMDDFAACHEVATMLNQRHPNGRFGCWPAN
jgi:hypothetical protein